MATINFNILTVRVKKLRKDVEMPKYMTAGAVGFDLRAVESAFVQPGATVRIGTGLAFELPSWMEMQVRPRSGLNSQGIQLLFGTIDSDYRGEVCLLVHNTTQTPYRVIKGDRIAQGVLAPALRGTLVEVDELNSTERGSNGFGSTGISDSGKVVEQCSNGSGSMVASVSVEK